MVKVSESKEERERSGLSNWSFSAPALGPMVLADDCLCDRGEKTAGPPEELMSRCGLCVNSIYVSQFLFIN